MKYRINHTTKYTYSEAVPVCHNLVRLTPRNLPYQTCDHFQLLVHPEPIDITNRDDYFGNRVSYFSIDQAHLGLTVSATSEIRVMERAELAPRPSVSWEAIATALRSAKTPEVLSAYQFVAQSNRVSPFAGLEDYTLKSFRPGRPMIESLMELTTRIYDEFTYDPRATTIQTPIAEVFEKRHGVCQDFAHLQIGCLRSIGLAARYVSGYLRTVPPPGKPRLVGADASHAWLSVYCGDVGWVDIDPTNNMLTNSNHVTIAWGRDYDDVSPIQGVITGGGEHKMHVSVDVAPQEELAS